METLPVTAAILTHDEEVMLPGCLNCLSWCQEIIVLDQYSRDNSAAVARSYGAIVQQSSEDSFARRRERLMDLAKTEWILYVDADERITPDLAREIAELLKTQNSLTAVGFPRKNFFFGKEFRNGGWQRERVVRLFRKNALRGWHGAIHESPLYEGEAVFTIQPLLHFTHRSVRDGLLKTAAWTPFEAAELAAVVPPVSPWTVARKGLGELWRRGIKEHGWKDGQAGVMEVVTQAINRMLVYMQVWELQQQPPIADHYRKLEQTISDEWKTNT